jgi:chromosome segregation ATPase
MVSSHNEGGATKPFRFTGSELSYVWLIDKKVYHKLGSFTVKYVNFPFVMPHVATKKDEKTKTEELRKKRLALEKELDKQAAPLDKKRVELENILDSYVSQRDKIKEEKFKPAQDRLDLIKHFDKDNSEKMRLEEQRDEAREDIKELEEEARNIRAKIKALDAKRERMWAKLVKQAATK